MSIPEYVLAALAAVALIVAVVFGLPIAYSFFQQLRENKSVGEMQSALDHMKLSLKQSELGYDNIVSSLRSLAETVFIQRAVFEEISGSENEKLKRTDKAFFEQRQQFMKMVHHAGLAHPDDQIALRSSFALATEFGDLDTADLMAKLESLRLPINRAEFERHRRYLLHRLKLVG